MDAPASAADVVDQVHSLPRHDVSGGHHPRLWRRVCGLERRAEDARNEGDRGRGDALGKLVCDLERRHTRAGWLSRWLVGCLLRLLIGF